MSSAEADKLNQLFLMQQEFDNRAQTKPLKETLFAKYYPLLIREMSMLLNKEVTFRDLPQLLQVSLLMSALIGEGKETQEALGLLPEYGAKWWKENIDWDLVKEELMDILHFLLSAFLRAGMNAEEVFQRYYDKWLINQQRQDTHY